MKDKNNNLEQQLADKLGNRSIAPTRQAWDRIARNREQGKDKKKKKQTYLYYAASIALVMLFGSYFFTTVNNDVETGPQVVTSGNTEKTVSAEEDVIVPGFALPAQEAEKIIVHNVAKQLDVAALPREEVKMIAGSYGDLQVNESLPNVSVALLPEVKTITKDKLYDQEVDYLLKNAFREVAADKHLSKPTDNTALLKEVEAEMDEYYRDKAMGVFSLRHKKIRIAVRE